MMSKSIVACFVMLLLGSAAARANDSTAELGAGGLQLVRSYAIELVAEDLYVSPTEIRVNYRFRNKTMTAITTIVAFPLPAIDATVPEALNVVLPNLESENFVDFRVSVDGAPVTPSVNSRVTALGVDRTAELTALRLPLNPYAESLRARIKTLSADTRVAMNRLGLLLPEEDEFQAAWKLETTFYWHQAFPPGREVAVEHRYRPVVGFAFFGMNSLDDKAMRARYCMDDAFVRAARERLNAIRNAPNPYLSEQRIAYVLTTGNNWASPIKSFRLVVDKGEPEALVSFCGENVRRISPTQFEMRATDFAPQREFDMLVVRPLTKQ
jgi:hypothetical protein